MESFAELVRKHGLLNAFRHGGKADLSAVVSRVMAERPDLKPQIKDLMSEIRRVVEEVNLLKPEDQSQMLQSKFSDAYQELFKRRVEVKELPPLPNVVKGSFMVRLPPEPSGVMHIGHAMAGLINYFYAQQYDGKIWLRFEDTNPRKVKREYYDSFREGYRWLDIKWDYEKNVSDDIIEIYKQGERFISAGNAYVCSCSPETIKRSRHHGLTCDCRSRPEGENLDLWSRMLKGEFSEGEVVVRFKGDMKSVDTSMRDPNLFRIVDSPHPLLGRKFKVWPVYDFAVVVEDHLCKVTHILRSLEFHESLQDTLRGLLGFSPVTTIQFSRFSFAGTPVAKRLLRPLIEEHKIEGWDDPRMPTISGLIRRGILADTIRMFTREVGYTKAGHVFDWSLLNSVNRKILDPVSKRYFFVAEPRRLIVEGAPEVKVDLKLHPDKDLGSRSVLATGSFYVSSDDAERIGVGEEVRLMELYNLRLLEKGSVLRGAYTGDELRTELPKIQWVTDENSEFTILVPGPIFLDGEFNDKSLKEIKGYSETACRTLQVGEIVQFVRVGFCRIDAPNVAIMAHK